MEGRKLKFLALSDRIYGIVAWIERYKNLALLLTSERCVGTELAFIKNQWLNLVLTSFGAELSF